MRRALLFLCPVILLAVAPGGVPGVQVKLDTLKRAFTFHLGGTPDWMALTVDAVWISNAKLKALQRIDPATNTMVAKIDLAAEPCSGLASGFGSLWVPLCGKGAGIARVDLVTNKVTAFVPVPPANSEGGITVSAKSVWMVSAKAMLTEIDPGTNRVTGTVELPAGSANPLYVGGFLWITSFATNQVSVVDPAKREVIAKVPTGPGPRFLTTGAGSVWTLNQGDGTVTRIDVAARKAIATITEGIPGTGGEIAFGSDSVWTTLFDIPLTRLDAKTNQVVKQWAGFGGDSVRFGFGSIWLTDLRSGLLWRIDQAAVLN